MIVGGLSPARPATAPVQAIVDKVKSQLESRVNQTFSTFQAVEYRTQVVAGTNYYIKVQYGNGTHDFAHLCVFKALPVYGGQIELTGYQMGHTRTDPLNYF